MNESMKGAFITMDVTFAILIAIIGLSIAYQTLDVGQGDVWRYDAHHKMAQDMILVLDKNGTLTRIAAMSEAAGEAVLYNSVNDLLPDTFAANVTFTVYEETTPDNFGFRSSNPVYSVRVPVSWGQNQTVYAKRLWVKIDDANAENNEFGIVEIRMWTLV